MLSLKFLKSFHIYNLLLIFLFSTSINSLNVFYYINIISFVLFHFVIIYLSLYYYRKINYLIFFMYGLGFDIILINQIGPHLIVFLSSLLIINLTKKYYQDIDEIKIYFLIFFMISIIFFIEMLLIKWFFGYDISIDNYIKFIMISIISSLPVFLIFSKIDRLN